MSNVDIVKELSTLREDIERHINMELVNVTNSSNQETISDLRAFVRAAYHVGLITADEVHRCAAAIRLAHGKAVTIHFAPLGDIGNVFASCDTLSGFLADKLLAKYEDTLNGADICMKNCHNEPLCRTRVDKNWLLNAKNEIRNAKAYLQVGLKTSLLQDAQVAQYINRANQMLDAINKETV